MTIGEFGWGYLRIGTRYGVADVVISQVVDVVGALVDATDAILRGKHQEQLDWDHEISEAGVVITLLDDGQVGFDVRWRGRSIGRTGFLCEIRTQQTAAELGERVLEFADAIDPDLY